MSKPTNPRPDLTAQPATPLGERDFAAPDKAKRAVCVFVGPDLGGVEHGSVAREDDEDAGRHARRAATLDRLFGKGC